MIKKHLKIIALIFLVSICIVTVIIKPIRVQGNSMEPNLKNGDWVLVNRLAYFTSFPQRGDIILFISRGDKEQYFLKRVVGLENETIEISSGNILLNGKELSESYILILSNSNFAKRIIPPNNVFVLGDNREYSKDSRYKEISFIDKRHIIGKIIFKW